VFRAHAQLPPLSNSVILQMVLCFVNVAVVVFLFALFFLLRGACNECARPRSVLFSTYPFYNENPPISPLLSFSIEFHDIYHSIRAVLWLQRTQLHTRATISSRYRKQKLTLSMNAQWVACARSEKGCHGGKKARLPQKYKTILV
jgi:hypothetical protein